MGKRGRTKIGHYAHTFSHTHTHARQGLWKGGMVGRAGHGVWAIGDTSSAASVSVLAWGAGGRLVFFFCVRMARAWLGS